MMHRVLSCLSLILLVSSTAAFHSLALLRRDSPSRSSKTDLATHLDAATDAPTAEVSRRVSLVIAAAIAAGTIATPADAATLAKKVSALETSNAANSNGAPEKHLPRVTVEASTVQVVVPHVMDPEKPHFIEYVWLKDIKSSEVVAVQAYQATDAAPPTLTASVTPGSTVKPLLYCNLHGLWEGETITV